VKTSDFDYHLPPELIAQTPIEPRDAARLLVVERSTGQLQHRSFRDIGEYLRPGDLLVGNNSRVIPARLHGVKATGGAVEIFLLRPAQALAPLPPPPSQRGRAGVGAGAWECLVGGKGLRPGTRVTVQHGPGSPDIVATILAETESGGRLAAFEPPVEEWLWDVGQTPLPPYIHTPLADPERYQTVYSRIEGSVASSTAGLHFTPELLLALRGRGINLAFVTLHIGLDTFRPVQAENIEEHRIHREWAQLSAETARQINEARLAGSRVIAVGTTVVRTLESAAKIALGYRPCDAIPADAVCGWQRVAAFTGETDLFIRPGHAFRAVDVMLTNFHLPKSTLLMLVSAFAGKELIDRAYAEAIRERYRFFSFGDAMLIL
jgi:S-adenosylmethionine:tRNA ribosyltransferase-isomerase